ncbi:MFS transporter [Nonomuraea sp. NPDC003727]
MSAGLPLRLARAAVFAVVCVLMGVVAHVVAGGPVAGRTAAVGLAVSMAAGMPIAGRERGLRVILPLLTAVQAVLHVIFSTAHAPDPVQVLTGHAHGLTPGFGMLLMHGWAVVMVAVWLAKGEAALWGMLRRLGARLVRLLAVWPAIPGPRRASAGFAEPAVLRTAMLHRGISERGPPPARAR